MREINLVQQTRNYDDEPFKMLDEKEQVTDLTLGRAAMIQIYKTVSADKETQFQTFELGLKIRKAIRKGDESLLLEGAEYAHLKTIMERNVHGFSDVIQAQFQHMIDDVPEVEVQKAE